MLAASGGRRQLDAVAPAPHGADSWSRTRRVDDLPREAAVSRLNSARANTRAEAIIWRCSALMWKSMR
jgi:hypothetical protein